MCSQDEMKDKPDLVYADVYPFPSFQRGTNDILPPNNLCNIYTTVHNITTKWVYYKILLFILLSKNQNKKIKSLRVTRASVSFICIFSVKLELQWSSKWIVVSGFGYKSIIILP